MKQGESTLVFSTGKTQFVLYPEVYTQFWFKLNREHQDIIRAMQMAQVTTKDKSVFDFLNRILNVNVTPDMPMEVGYQIYYDALDRRSHSILEKSMIEQEASNISDVDFGAVKRNDPSKPIFQDKEEKK